MDRGDHVIVRHYRIRNAVASRYGEVALVSAA